MIKDLIPEKDYKHDLIDDNAAAHLASAFLGQSVTFPVKNSRLVRGTWQNIFLVELDGPRSQRRIVVEVIGKRN
jgi:secondary thiamine-phosphate synthase enzyme